MIDRNRLIERHALLVRLNRLSDQTGAKAGGFTSWGEVWTVGPKRSMPILGDHDALFSPAPGLGLAALARGEHHLNAPKQLGFGHMDRIAREMRQP